MGTDLNSNHTISLYMGLYNLRNKIKYTPKVGTMQGQLMLQERITLFFFSSLSLLEGFTDIWNVFKSVILSSLGEWVGWNMKQFIKSRAVLSAEQMKE